MCQTYDLHGLGAMRVALRFSAEDRLVSYVVYMARNRQKAVRTKIESVYGPPTNQWEKGRSSKWQWPSGTEATLTILCQGTDGCLIVKAKAPEPPKKKATPPARAA